MKTRTVAFLLFLSMCRCAPLWARVSESDRRQIDRTLGTTGIYTPSEDTYRVTFPRTDVKVTVNNRTLSPFAGFSSCAAMTSDPHHGGALLLAEFALLEDEVNPVVSVALDSDLEVTALHSDLLFERPHVLSLHISGLGEPRALAAKLRQILDKIRTVRSKNPIPVSQVESSLAPGKSSITASVLDSILETHGLTEDGMYKASMGMRGLVHGIPIGKQMGLSTWIAFTGTDERAVVDGQIVMTKGQIQGVLRALRKAGINIAALYNTMIEDHPAFFFVRYRGEGQATELARGVRAALETQLR